MLIRVLAGVQLLPLHKLGWDTTMRVVSKNIRIPISSFESLGLSHPIPGSQKDSPFWVDEMPDPSDDDPMKMDPKNKEMFILVYAISLAQGDQIRGRSTRVWKAWKMSDMMKKMKNRKVCPFTSGYVHPS